MGSDGGGKSHGLPPGRLARGSHIPGRGLLAVDRDWRVTYVNQLGTADLQAAPGDLIGQSLWEMVPQLRGTEHETRLRRAMRRGEVEQWEGRAAVGDRCLAIVAWPSPDGLLVSWEDLTELRKTEEALRASEHRARAVIDHSPAGIMELDYRGPRVISLNDAMCRISGYSREEILRMNPAEILTEKSRQLFRDRIAHRLAGEGVPAATEYEIKKADGSIAHVIIDVALLEGEPRTGLIIAHDITERKSAEKVKDELIGMVSHELKTPMTVIVGAVNTVLTDRARLSTAETRRLLEDAASAADALSDILENLLELSRSQADRLVLQVEMVDLQKVIQKTLHEARRHDSAHQFHTDLPTPLPPLRADRIRLERILHNLVENAVKYSSGGDIRVSAAPNGDNVVVGVHDQGPGLSPENQPKLFQPFQRLRTSETTDVEGTGLGLVVCRRLVEAHGGRIWVESTLGEGTSFCFTLPRS